MAKKGYWIAHVNITNPERYKDYVAANAAPLKKYGARFLVRNGELEVTRGTARRPPARGDRVRQLCHRQGLSRLARIPGGGQDPRRGQHRASSSSSKATRAERAAPAAISNPKTSPRVSRSPVDVDECAGIAAHGPSSRDVFVLHRSLPGRDGAAHTNGSGRSLGLSSHILLYRHDEPGGGAAATSQVGAIPAADVVVAASAEQARTSSIRRPGI